MPSHFTVIVHARPRMSCRACETVFQPPMRTRLEGTTWYTNRMWPPPYWNLRSDYVIQRIHRRVLTHIQKLAASPGVFHG